MTDKKPRARRTKRKETSASLLLEALKFLKPCQSKSGPPEQQFCQISNGWVVASNEMLTIGTKIEEPLNCCPHSFQLIDALSRVDDDLAITQLEATALAVTAGGFRALVQCLPTGSVPLSAPDAAHYVLTDDLKPALAAAAILAGNEARPEIAPVLLQAQTCVGTNGFAIVEHYHGIDLPPNILLPKAAAVLVAKCGKGLARFGFSQSSFTFWFEDESFIKTQLYSGNYVNYNNSFKDADYSKLYNAPEEFFKALEYLKPFCDGAVYFKNGKVATSLNEGKASTYELPFLPDDMGFNSELLLQLQDYIKRFYFDKEKRKLHFCSDKSRGALMGLDITPVMPAPVEDDDIPF